MRCYCSLLHQRSHGIKVKSSKTPVECSADAVDLVLFPFRASGLEIGSFSTMVDDTEKTRWRESH